MSSPTKYTVNLGPKTMTALAEAAQLEEKPRTDVINRAIQLYALIASKRAAGSELVLRDSDGKLEVLHLF